MFYAAVVKQIDFNQKAHERFDEYVRKMHQKEAFDIFFTLYSKTTTALEEAHVSSVDI